MKTSEKKLAYDHDSIKDLYENDDWVDEDQLRNKKNQKNKSKHRKSINKEYLFRE